MPTDRGIPTDTGNWTLVVAVALVTVALVGAMTVGAQLTQAQHQRPAEQQQPTRRFVYPAKFVCGSLGEAQAADPPGATERFEQEPPVKPGDYATSINVHNFREREVNITINVTANVALPRGISARGTSGETTTTLSPHEGVELECADIGDLVSASGASYVEGTVVIEVPRRLEVEGVYTARTRSDADNGAGDGDGVEAAESTRTVVVGGPSIDVEDIEPYRIKVTPGDGERGPPDDGGP